MSPARGDRLTATSTQPGVPSAAAEPPRYSHRQILEILGALIIAMLTSMLSSTVVATALPTIVGELGGQEHYSWVASATLLTMTASTPLWGKVSDILGRKLMFQTALGIFVVASAAAGFSDNIWMLIGARAVQGIGAGGLSALTQVILGDIVEPRERGRYSGYLGAVFGVATVAGPLLGGFLVDHGGWRWCFFVGIPLAVIAFIVIQKVLKLPRVHRDTKVDWYGAVTITAAAASIMVMLSMGGQQWAWNSVPTYLLGGGALVMLLLAIPSEIKAKNPILPSHLFRNRTFVLTGLASLFVGMAMFGGIIYLPQYLQIVKGLSPTSSGLMTLPMVVGLFVASISTGQLVSRTGRWKIFPSIGLLMVACGLFLLHLLEVDTSLWLVGVFIAILGVGLGMTMQVLILSAQNAVARTDMASTTSGISFFRNLGGAIGVAAFGAVLNSRVEDEMAKMLAAAHIRLPSGAGAPTLGSPEAIHHLPGEVQDIVLEAFDRGMQTVFLWAVPAAILGFLAVLVLKEIPLRTARRGESGDASKAETEGAAPGTAQQARPTSDGPPDALIIGLLLELIAARLHTATDPRSALVASAAELDGGTGDAFERARRAADQVIRPLALDLLRSAAHPAASHDPEHAHVEGGVTA